MALSQMQTPGKQECIAPAAARPDASLPSPGLPSPVHAAPSAVLPPLNLTQPASAAAASSLTADCQGVTPPLLSCSPTQTRAAPDSCAAAAGLGAPAGSDRFAEQIHAPGGRQNASASSGAMSRGVRDFSDDFMVEDAACECRRAPGSWRQCRRRSPWSSPLAAAQVAPPPLALTACRAPNICPACLVAAGRRRTPGGFPAGAPPPTAERESDPHRLAQRQKQVGGRQSGRPSSLRLGFAVACRRELSLCSC